MKPDMTGYAPQYVEETLTLEQVKSLEGEVLLEFGAPWCGHCQAAQPAIESVFSQSPSLPHIKIYDGKGKPLGRAYRVTRWPTLILIRDGKEVARLVRPLRAEEVQTLIDTPAE